MTPSVFQRISALWVIGCLCFAVTVSGQEVDPPLEEMALPKLAARADEAHAKNPATALPFLIEIRERLLEADSATYREILRETIFRLGRVEMERYIATGEGDALRRANEYWSEFLKDFGLDPRARLALLNRADGYFALGIWDEAVADYARLLGIEFRAQLLEEEQVNVLEKIARSLREMGELDQAEPYLYALLEAEATTPVRSFAANALLDGFIRAGTLDALVRMIPLLRSDPLFRFDYGINVRLLGAGDEFADEEVYLKAAFLYSLVLPLSDILIRVEDRLIFVEEILFNKSFRPTDEAELLVEREDLLVRRGEIVEAPNYTGDLKWRQALILRKMGRRFEAYFAFRRLMDEHDDHDRIEQFHYTSFRQAQDCDYRNEAILLGESYLANLDYLAYEKPIHAQLGFFYLQEGRTADLARLTESFLHRFPEDPVSGQLTHLLGAAWFRDGDIHLVLETFVPWLREYPGGSFRESTWYWTGMAKIMEGRFEAAREDFQFILTNFPGSVYAAEARFRLAVCDFGEGDYSLAEARFVEWVATFPEHPLRPEAEAFLGDLAAMDPRVEDALRHYQLVEELGGTGRLIDHSYFEAARLLEVNGRFEEMREWLGRYIANYPSRPEVAQAVLLIAETDFAEGFTRAAFERYRSAATAFGNRSGSDAVDRVLDEWWIRYEDLRAMVTADRSFVSLLLADEIFRDRILRDRVFSIGWFRENPHVSESIQNEISSQGETRDELISSTQDGAESKGKLLSLADFPELENILTESVTKWEKAPDVSPAVEFAVLREQALEDDRITLALRLERVLATRGNAPSERENFSAREVGVASPATLVWMASVVGDQDPERAKVFFERVIDEYPESEAAMEALYERGNQQIEAGLLGLAISDFDRILDEYPENNLTLPTTFGLADALLQSAEYDRAIEVFSSVLERREWRGEAWARATFGIGMAFSLKGELGKAQGFFERTYLAYGRFEPWSGLAYRESGRVLEELGEMESARRTYEAFLALQDAERSPVFEEIRERLAQIPETEDAT